MRQAIRGYVDALVETLSEAGALEQASEELAAVAALVRGSDDLRRALSDPGVPAVARRAVLVELLEGRVRPEPVRLVAYAVVSDRPNELLGNLDWVAARLSAAAGGRQPVSEVLLGCTAAAERIGGYATAVLEDVAGEAELGDLEDELFRFMRVVDGSPELSAALTSRDVPAAVRRSLVLDLVAARASQAAARLAAYATRVGRPRDYPGQLARLVERVAAERDLRLADVRSAVELDEGQRSRLESALGRLAGRRVEVRVAVDPGLLGGFVARIGNTVVDGSVRHRLEVLKERLTLAQATISIQGGPR